jgi:hypothetical protein
MSKSVTKRAFHDTQGYHHMAFGHHRLNVGHKRIEVINRPCKNKNCASYGHAHPNCRCYAKGGDVDHFCSGDHAHEKGCQYFAQGGSAMKGLNLSGFKKLKEDAKTVTMAHPKGHAIMILKSRVSPTQKKQLEDLPLHMDEGGDTGDAPTQAPDNFESAANPTNANMEGDVPNSPLMNDSTSNSDVAQNSPSPASIGTPTAMPQDPSGLGNLSLGDVYGKELKGIHQQTAAQSGLAQNQMQIEQDQQKAMQAAQDNWVKTSTPMLADVSAALDDAKKGHIDPSHYLENMGTGQKIATAIGLLFGGFTGGYNRTGVNPAAQWLEGQINRDVEAQRVNLAQKNNIFTAYLEKYKNAAVADQMARATQYGIYASKVREAAAKAGTPLAQAQGNILAAELEGKMIPLVQNGHLIQQFSAFNGGAGGGAGSEAQFKVALNAAQRLNPEMYKDQQSKYVPSIGVASHPVEQGDREAFVKLDSLIPLIQKAQNIRADAGRIGFLDPTKAAEADATKAALQVRLNELTQLNRLNHEEYGNYASQIGQVSGMDLFHSHAKTLDSLMQQAQMDRNSYIHSYGITPFSDAKAPTGLAPKSQNNLQIFMRNNPHVDHGTAMKVLKDKGMI